MSCNAKYTHTQHTHFPKSIMLYVHFIRYRNAQQNYLWIRNEILN